MKEERVRILNMVAEGKITPEQAAKLIEALESRDESETEPAREFNTSGKWLRINVTDAQTGKQRVNVRIPLGFVKFGSRLGARFMPELEGTNLDSILEAIEEGGTGKIIEVTDDEDGEHVVISVE